MMDRFDGARSEIEADIAAYDALVAEFRAEISGVRYAGEAVDILMSNGVNPYIAAKLISELGEVEAKVVKGEADMLLSVEIDSVMQDAGTHVRMIDVLMVTVNGNTTNYPWMSQDSDAPEIVQEMRDFLAANPE